MIGSFGDRTTHDLYHGIESKAARAIPPAAVGAALRKLDMLSAALELRDLWAPPGNRLEKLRGDLEGCHSIRVNDRYRLVFRWSGSDAKNVRFVDYHKG